MALWKTENGTVIGTHAISVFSAYSCQVVGNGDVKFPDTIDRIMQRFPNAEVIFIGGSDLDINGSPIGRINAGLVKFAYVRGTLYKIGEFETQLTAAQYKQISPRKLINMLGFKE